MTGHNLSSIFGFLKLDNLRRSFSRCDEMGFLSILYNKRVLITIDSLIINVCVHQQIVVGRPARRLASNGYPFNREMFSPVFSAPCGPPDWIKTFPLSHQVAFDSHTDTRQMRTLTHGHWVHVLFNGVPYSRSQRGMIRPAAPYVAWMTA